MAHYQQQKFVELISYYLPNFFTEKKVLEVGSWAVNGSARNFFSSCDYLGVDISEGPCVDMVCFGQDLAFPDNTFDTTMSLECFEHNPEWKKTFLNMIRMLKPGGLCIISCASFGRKEHGTSRSTPQASLTALTGKNDYYRNLSKGDLLRVVNLNDQFSDYRLFYNVYHRDLYFVGIKRHSRDLTKIPKSLVAAIKEIREEGRTSIYKIIRKHLGFVIVYILVKVIGEKNYHDFKHFLRKNILKKLNG